VQRERTRVREPAPAASPDYEATLKHFNEQRERALQGNFVLRGAERPWKQSRQARAQMFINRAYDTGSPLKDWIVFIQDIREHSGKHRHQGGLVIYVLEGSGYTEVDGERIEWEAGDLLLLPIKPKGVEHQHFNKRPGENCKWMAFIYLPYCDEIGFYLEHRENHPDYRRSE
jgi:gentisate 1,2-dioxygenase